MEVANSFGQFLKLESCKLKKMNSKAKLNFDKTRLKWKTMSNEGKSSFRDMSVQDKVKLGGNYRKKISKSAKTVEDVKEYDRARKLKERCVNKVKKENDKLCSDKFKLMLKKMGDKYENMMKKQQLLEKEFKDLEAQNSELAKTLETKPDFWKTKYKQLFEEHESCKRRGGM